MLPENDFHGQKIIACLSFKNVLLVPGDNLTYVLMKEKEILLPLRESEEKYTTEG